MTFLLAAGTNPGGAQTAPENSAARPAVNLSPNKVNFGSHAVAVAGEAQTVTLKNSGDSEVRITAILASGIDFSQTNSCAATLAPGASCTIRVNFKPVISGSRMATLNVFDSAVGSPQSVVLTGTGL